ncbi:hypothetical protein [Profundibacter sp.]|uniref:hypothetical protein n=1 Tax=Profundibacter sp. TaxID=3101071 RepID=UPI003D10B17E
MIRSNQAGQAKNRPPRREEGENGNLQRFPSVYSEETLLAMSINNLNSNLFPEALNAWLKICPPYDNITRLAYFPTKHKFR